MKERKSSQASNSDQTFLTVDDVYKLAADHYNAKQYKEADQICKAILQGAPSYFNAINLLGVIAIELSQHELSVELFQKVIAIKPDYADAYCNLGVALQNMGKLDEAVTNYKKAVAIKPDYVNAYFGLGNILEEQGKLEEAVTSIQKAISIKLDFADAYYNLGVILHKMGKLDEAVTSYKKAIAIKPDYPEAHSNLSISQKEQGNLDEAVTSIQKAISIKPDYAIYHSNLGNILEEQGKLEEAVTSIQKAISIKSDYAGAYCNLGVVLHKMGKLDEAVISYKKAIAIKPDYASAYYNLGKLYLSSDIEIAEKHIKKSLEIEPNCGIHGKREIHRVLLMKKSFINMNKINARLLATMPRSGTFYSKYFFRYYDELLSGNKILTTDISPLFYKPKSLGFDIFNVIHAECPGFDDKNNNDLFLNDSPNYIQNGYNIGKSFISILDDEYSPKKNKNVRIAYLYRNPLDQVISYFFHCRNHVKPFLRNQTHIRSNQTESDAIKDYFFSFALEGYIKQYFTYKNMCRHFPEQIKMFHYESLKNNPEKIFGEILIHFGHDPFTSERNTAFFAALDKTNEGNMKQIELKRKTSLAGDQISSSSSHIRSGKIGNWKNYFNEKELNETECRLNKYGISLDDFILE
ncbi:MAG: tetratricopeptide repeat protein [Magnetococcales bacterium]|nr:tetratricopeptide repeat protein [Magnetococcales bacterium]